MKRIYRKFLPAYEVYLPKIYVQIRANLATHCDRVVYCQQGKTWSNIVVTCGELYEC